MKSLIFAECLAALKNNDFDFVEARIAQVKSSPMEPAAAALYTSICDQVARRRASQVRPSAVVSVAPVTEIVNEISSPETTKVLIGSAKPLAPPQDIPARAMADTAVSDGSEFLLSAHDCGLPLPGISIVAGCMNREENLMKVIGSWLATDAAEIIVVDWSSASELWPKLSAIGDPRLKVIRIENEKHWIAAHALNVGLRFASRERVFRVDCDILVSPDFLKMNLPQRGEFIRGFWRAGLVTGGEGQQFIQGTFGAFKLDLREANYYDERILTYGWEDSELYLRFTHDFGLAGKQINPTSLRHVEQAEELRITNQGVSRNRFLGKFEPTEFEGAKNKFYAAIAGGWARYLEPQDYRIAEREPGLFCGTRVTKMPRRDPEIQQLSESLAARQLAIWAASMPDVGGSGDVGMDYANLLRDAHAINRSRELVVGAHGTPQCFIYCEPGPCRAALRKTLQVLHSHNPSFSRYLVLIEDSPSDAPVSPSADGALSVLSTSGKIIDVLSKRAQSRQIPHLAELESLIGSRNEVAVHLSISARALAGDAIRKAVQFSEKLGDQFESLPSPVAGTCLVTSLYDDNNLIRLVEYLACIVENLRVFERVAIFYEASTGLLTAVLDELLQELAVPPGRLLILPYQKRPTFEELFSARTLFPNGTIVAVANADVAFDATFEKIKQVDLSRNVVVLSRRDISRDGRKASLIRLENGTPNTFSADAWIVSTPFEPDFFLDYPIGTMHCDSFINHQVSRSKRYSVINPCLDVRVYHLHDDRFNSSAQKQQRDFEEIKRIYKLERARNEDVDPINGVAWSTLATAAIVPEELQLQRWKPTTLGIDLASCGTPTLGHFLALHLLYETVRFLKDAVMVVRLTRDVAAGPFGVLLARYQTEFACSTLLVDMVDAGFDAKAAPPEGTVIRPLDFGTVVDWIVNETRDKRTKNTCVLLEWPQTKGAMLLCCEVNGEMTADATSSLIDALWIRERDLVERLLNFVRKLPAHSAEQRLVTPFFAPLLHEAPPPSALKRAQAKPRVSFITSLFQGGAFLPAFLTNVLAAARKAQGEVIIIDANSGDHDSQIVNEFLQRHPDAGDYIEYLRLDHDPGLYECWKIGIEHSKAEFVTNANIDDRRCPQHTARLVRLLEDHPEYAGACGGISCVTADGTGDWFTLYENQVWFYGEGIHQIGFEDLYRIDDRGDAKSRDVMHCMPVWRKSLHQRYGYFDEAAYGTSADWAFWLKCTKAGEKFAFDDGAFGQYFMNPNSHNRRNDPEGLKERRIINDFIGIEQSGFTKQ